MADTASLVTTTGMVTITHWPRMAMDNTSNHITAVSSIYTSTRIPIEINCSTVPASESATFVDRPYQPSFFSLSRDLSQ